MKNHYILRAMLFSMLVLLCTTFSYAGGIPGLTNATPAIARVPIVNSGISSWGNDIVVSASGDDQTSSDVYVTSFGWIYVSMSTVSPAGGGIRIAVSKDNGETFSNIYEGAFFGYYYSSLRIVVPGYDSTTAKIFMAGIVTETSTGSRNTFIVFVDAGSLSVINRHTDCIC